jgi:hypothetical protein
MTTLSESAKNARFVRAIITYVDPNAAIGAHHDTDNSKSTLKPVRYEMPVFDLRSVSAPLSLEEDGFVVVTRPSAGKNFEDAEEIATTYTKEAEALVKELTGAEKVIVFGHAFRNATPGLPVGTRKPAYMAHIDYNEETVRAVARKHLSPEEYARRGQSRIVLVNVWRPIETVESAPLAVCDPRSISPEDLIHGPIGGASVSGIPGAAGFNLAHNPKHRWYYLSKMQPDEVLAFKLCDSDRSRVQLTAHTAFDDPSSPPDARPRRSIELRTLAFMNSGWGEIQ